VLIRHNAVAGQNAVTQGFCCQKKGVYCTTLSQGPKEISVPGGSAKPRIPGGSLSIARQFTGGSGAQATRFPEGDLKLT
jgi:hypothetical protein